MRSILSVQSELRSRRCLRWCLQSRWRWRRWWRLRWRWRQRGLEPWRWGRIREPREERLIGVRPSRHYGVVDGPCGSEEHDDAERDQPPCDSPNSRACAHFWKEKVRILSLIKGKMSSNFSDACSCTKSQLGCTNRSLQLTTRLGWRRMPSLDACWPRRYPAGLCLHLMFAGRAPMYAHVTLPVTTTVVAKEVLELFQRETRVAGQVGLHLYQTTRTHTAKAAQGVSTMPCTGLLSGADAACETSC